MKKEFIGYYNPTVQEIDEAWSKGIFAFDANALLNLYRYSALTRKDFLSAFNTLKDKLFLPHQAALEFHTNRLGVIDAIEYSYDNLYKIFESNFEKNIEQQINQFKKHPSIIIENISKLYSEFLKKITLELEKRKKEHPDFKSKDDVLEQLTELFENSIGKEFSKEELIKIFTEGKVRYADNVPPGYKDLENKRKRGERHIYGDLIVWKELINYSKKEKKPLIFVTDDRKEDWWTIENGKTIRPREELIKEFFDLTGIRILIYNADNFLQYAKERKLLPELKDKTIKEVKEVRISDENTYMRINDIPNPSYYLRNTLTASDLLASRSTLLNYPYTTADIMDPHTKALRYPFTTADILDNQSKLLHYPYTVSDLLDSRNSQVYNPLTVSELLARHSYLSGITPTDSLKIGDDPIKPEDSKKKEE